MNKNTIIILLSLFTLSCSDWLDVRPKTEIKSDDNFESEQGFKDALTGIYLLMSRESLYGKDLTFGMVEYLGKEYTQLWSNSNSYYYIFNYDYEHENSISIINSVWRNMYNTIANINNLIGNIDERTPSFFTGENYNIIKGEAYGLRAFLHFDLLRLFAPAYIVDAEATAIPYVNTFNNLVTPSSSVREVIDLILKDLEVAEDCLKMDPIFEGREGNLNDDSDYVVDRFYKFNYYAIKLLQARVNIYKGNYNEALNAAKEIIEQETFYWVPESEITTGDAYMNRVFSEELIFTLYKTDLQSSYNEMTNSGNGMFKASYQYDEVYEITKAGYSSDYRYQYLLELIDYNYYCSKLKQSTSSNYYTKRLPVMRISEAYYIAAECYLNLSDKTNAVNSLNIVREHRNLGGDPLQSTLSESEIQNEIRKEYEKEFMCEGQMFYYYKRVNSSTINFYNGSTENIYVLPLPDDEIEYGNRYSE